VLVWLMGSSFLSEVDDTSILRTGALHRYHYPLTWPPASRLLLPRSGLERSDFVHCRFSDAGRRSAWIASSCRRPKTYTTADIVRRAAMNRHCDNPDRRRCPVWTFFEVERKAKSRRVRVNGAGLVSGAWHRAHGERSPTWRAPMHLGGEIGSRRYNGFRMPRKYRRRPDRVPQPKTSSVRRS
jgi:hypothetical protein